MRIVFMGSPDFALATLRRLIESDHDIVGVVTQPDRPAGRGQRLQPPPAKLLALDHGLRVLQPERVNRPESLTAIGELAPDALVIAAYGQILRQPLLDLPRRGALNVHASVLPRYRGASPVAAAILAGDEETGITILEVVLALDAGPILAQRPLPIEPHDTTGTLTDKLSSLGAELLIEVLPLWERGKITARPQDDSTATYAPTLSKEDAVIDWSLPADEIWRRVRAYNPWPVATTTLAGQTLRIWEARPLDDVPAASHGTVISPAAPGPSGFAVRCGHGSLAIVRAQRTGKRAVTGDELLRGMPGLLGQRLGT